MTTIPRMVDLAVDAPRITVSPDASSVELFSNLVGTIQQMVTSAICENLEVLVPTRATTPSKVTALEQANQPW
ncbi:UNVERIFIED_CONTAM: hypothetical protein Sradi_3814300 [Sesamum radiatum]|uniref:Uncharacterized protein n=1 Tax=Sesamum radiatum TaxID=300843 RepID=A0AAW2Q0U7_SESRA